jgi:hypothetical protein
MAGIKVIGSESLQRKLDALGREAPKAQRYGLAQAGRFTVWMLKGAAPERGKNEFATGATKAALGRVEQRTETGYSQWIGIKDKEFVKKMYARRRAVDMDDESAGVVEQLSPKKNKAQGFIHEVSVVKKPFDYAFIHEKRHGWFYSTWRKVSGNAMNIAIRKTDDKIKELLAKKGA